MLCAYNLTTKNVLINIGAVEDQRITFSECVCSLSYPACKAHAPYFIAICDLSVSAVFFTISHNQHNFRGGGKKLLQ
jgi:hypothetical protein